METSTKIGREQWKTHVKGNHFSQKLEAKGDKREKKAERGENSHQTGEQRVTKGEFNGNKAKDNVPLIEISSPFN